VVIRVRMAAPLLIGWESGAAKLGVGVTPELRRHSYGRALPQRPVASCA
jgi:hypothetical protein